jgi:pimeloyl-ACP methyl ester carboxylesterase/DNA-binding CsgD family transcriptional regulator
VNPSSPLASVTEPDDEGSAAVPATDALLHTVYQSALNPRRFQQLQGQLLQHFREDRSADDTPRTRVVLRHLQRALRLGATHSALQREGRRVQDAIDAASPPVVVVDAAHRVLGTNAAADRLLAGHAQWGVEAGRLVCRQAGFLAGLLARANHHASTSARGGAGNDDLLVHVYRNAGPAGVPAEPAVYSLLLVDHGGSVSRAIARLAARCALTPRETEVLDLSLQGLAPEVLCERLQVTRHTLRQHVKHIHAKTGVRHQNGLFARVLQDVVVSQAARSNDARLLPHVAGLSQSRLLALGDGRQLSYAEYGDPAGRPVLYFHALNGSRLEPLMHDERLRAGGIRLIAMDRAGYGHSTFVERGCYREHVHDVVALLDALRLDRVHLMSASAGCAHALLAAHALGARVHDVHCTAVVPPIQYILGSASRTAMNSAMNRFFRIVPSLMRPAFELAMMGQTVESLLEAVTQSRDNLLSLTPSDVELVQRPGHQPYFVANMMESLRQGTRAWPVESTLVNRPWPIPLPEIRQPVHLWHGTDDGLVATDMVAAFAAALPDARLHVLPGESHLLVFRSIDRVIEGLHAAA